MAGRWKKSASFHWPPIRTGGVVGTCLVVLGGVIALVEALVFDVSEASWGVAILIIGTFLLIISVIVDLTVFLGQLIWRCLVWGWQSLFG